MNAPDLTTRVLPDSSSEPARMALQRLALMQPEAFSNYAVMKPRRKTSYSIISGETVMLLISAAIFVSLYMFENGSLQPLIRSAERMIGSSFR